MTSVVHRQDTRGLIVPPHSVEAEESVLGAVLMSADATNIALEKLRPEDFYRPAHQAVFQAISDLFNANQPIDAVTVSEALRRAGTLERVGGVGFLTGLIDAVPAASNVEYYSEIVEEHALRRRLIRVGGEVGTLASVMDEPISQVLDRAEQAVFGVSERRIGDGLAPIDPLLGPAIEKAEELARLGVDVTGIPTGFRDLDRKLAGLHPMNLLIIAARPGMGKCLAGDTEVVDPKTGTLCTIEAMVDDPELHGTSHVVALDVDRLKLVVAAPVEYHDNGVRETFRLRTRLGRQVVATDNHPLLTIEGWKTLRELRVGEEIAVPRRLDVFGVDAVLDGEAALLGYLVGSGDTGQGVLRVPSSDRELVDLEAWAASVGSRLEDVADGDETGYRLVPDPLASLLAEDGPAAASRDGARIPEAVYRFPQRQAALFLSRFFAAAPPTTTFVPDGRVELTSPSEPLVRGLQHLLLRFGIVARLRERPPHPQRPRPPTFTLSVDDPVSLATFEDSLGTFGSRPATEERATPLSPLHDLLPLSVWDVVLAEMGTRHSWASVAAATGRTGNGEWGVGERRLSRAELAELANAIDSDRLRTLACSEVVWDPVEVIEPAGRRRTFDLTVPIEHNFVAGDVVVHNSALALNIAQNVAVHDEPVAIFSLEMSREEVVTRMLCASGRIDSQRLRSGRLTETDFTKLSNAASTLYKKPIFVDDSAGLTVTEIRAKCRRLRRKPGLSLVVVDYLQLMQGSGGENRQQEIAQISRSLKNLARELDVPVLALSQLNRSLEAREDKRPRLSDLRESGSLEQDADVVMFIYRHEYYHPEAQETRGTAEVAIAKHRQGATGRVDMTFLPEFTLFADMGRDIPVV